MCAMFVIVYHVCDVCILFEMCVCVCHVCDVCMYVICVIYICMSHVCLTLALVGINQL